MEPTVELINEIDRDRIRRARAMTVEQRLLSAVELFDLTAEMMKAGIRSDVPNATDDQVHKIFLERLDRARRLEQIG